MAKGNDLLQTIEAVHAAGFDDMLWPHALASIGRLFDARAATLEDFEKKPVRLRYLKTSGVPPQGETAYLEHYAHNNSRARHAFKNLSQRFLCDYEFIDERRMDRDPYYAKYLGAMDLRYFLSGQIANSADHQAIVSIQRTQQQGHVGRADIERMRALIPHVSQAYDVTRRLRMTQGVADMLEAALNRLGEGVALLRGDGAIVHANDAFGTMARRADGLRVVAGLIEFSAAEARTRYAAAFRAAASLHGGKTRIDDNVDFLAARASGAPALIVSLRPLARAQRAEHEAAVIIFIRDPLGGAAGAFGLLQALFGLTEAESNLALALQRGLSPVAYAQTNGLSTNTVYTHLRHIKDKMGCRRLPELIRRLGDLRVPPHLNP